jgi:ADP-ribose pyrophosphatase YjhB (NUDIX family)
MTSPVQVAAAILRRGNEIVLVREAAPGEEPHWSLPGGQVEADELINEGLVREVLEETGLEVLELGPLALVVQTDNRNPELTHRGSQYLATVWVFEIEKWSGELAPRDPMGLVSEATFVALPEAIERLDTVSWHAHTVRYLRAELEPGSVVLQRWHENGRIEELARIAPSSPGDSL